MFALSNIARMITSHLRNICLNYDENGITQVILYKEFLAICQAAYTKFRLYTLFIIYNYSRYLNCHDLMYFIPKRPFSLLYK